MASKGKKTKPKGSAASGSNGDKITLNITNYIYPTDCENVQIGDNNSVVYPVEEAIELLEKTGRSTSQRNEVLIGMVNSIINPTCSPNPSEMSVWDLKSKFRQIYGRSFDEVCGLRIDQFLEKNKEWYEKFAIKKRMMVRPIIRRRRKKYSLQLSRGSDASDTVLPGDTCSESETDYLTAETQSGNDESDYCASSETDDEKMLQSSSSSQNEKWTVVRKRRSKTSQRETEIKDQQVMEDNIEYPKMDHEELHALFRSLIDKKESKDILFRKSMKEYAKHPCEFLLDIVSIWNTPGRSKSYIVVGIDLSKSESCRLIGMDKGIEMSKLHHLFDKDVVNFVPQFHCYELFTGKKYFVIIEILSSHGQGIPAITKVDVFHEKRKCLSKDELWYRPETERIKCSLSDPMMSCIHQWFAGSKEKKKESKPKLPTLESIKTKNAGTSTSCNSESSDNSIAETLVIGPTYQNFAKAVQTFSKGRYVLVAGDVPNGTVGIEAISRVPWIAVYDFDITSRDTGLLCANESFLSNRRSLHLATWKTPATPICENSTVWSFLRGRRDEPDSRLKDENDLRCWYRKVKGSIDQKLDQLQKFIEDYTVLTLLIIWPQEEQLAQFLHKFLLRVDETLDPSPKMVLCLQSEPKSKLGNSVLSLLCNEIQENLKIIYTGLPNICQWIKLMMKDQQTLTPVKYTLPSEDCDLGKDIEEKEAAWLREELDVLYLDNTYSKSKIDANALVEETENFFRGGSLHWFAWYECGAGHFDVERNIKEDVMKKIDGLISGNKSRIITLYHAPGAGGTTLAQRILWDFHTKIPCGHVKLRSPLPVTDLVERVEMLYDKSHKMVLLLIDGEDESKVKYLMRMLRARCYVIILYVKRFPHNPERQERMGNGARSFLDGKVSVEEARRLSLKFKDRCENDKTKIKKLMDLSDDVKMGTKHHMYEFGMTTYLHEFKGVESYVRGYLQMDQNIGNQLQQSQLILGYLALAYYYGQTSLPLQFFAPLLHKPANYCMELDDLPYPVREFVVTDLNESKKDNIRVCHYIVAKEILEQILGDSKRVGKARPSSVNFGPRLAEFCKKFIDYCGKKKVKSGGSIVHTLTKIFIFRDNKDMGENAEQTRRRPVLSRLMTDITSKPPLFTERLQVLEKLTASFPNDPNFHAHMGRFYSFYRPDEEEIAEKCFQRALELCEMQTRGKKEDEIDDRILQSLMHIYHMYGTVLQKRIARYTGQTPGDEPELQTEPENFESRMENMLQLAKRACSYFKKCREHTPPGHENCFGYVGEVTVRLQICDFVERNFSDSDGTFGIDGYLSKHDESDKRSVKFVKKSISRIDNLLMECYNVLEEDDIDHSIQRNVQWYNHLFCKHAVDLDRLVEGDDIHSCRLKIAAKKLQHGTKEKSLTILESIPKKKELEDIVALYENIFQRINSSVVKGSRATLDRDYQEWMFAIRHRCIDREYSLEDVLLQVRQWNDYLHSPMSKYYLFILTSLLGFGENNKKGKSECLVEAVEIHQKELNRVSRMVLKPKYPREWLGREGSGVKRLEPGVRFCGNIMVDDRSFKDDKNKFRICKGTICRPNNKKFSGYISLDLGNNIVPVKVFYIPHTAKMAGLAYADTRVEFILAFTLQFGYEAFNVRLLNRYPCPNEACSSQTEMTSDEGSTTCAACECPIVKDQ